MDKNNDIQVNKISKWDAAPDSIKDLYFAISGMFDGLSSFIDPQEADNDESALNGLLAKVLDNYNELEAVHQKECGMISQYEEENKKLKNKLDIMTDENDCLITRVFKQDEEYTKLEAEHKKLQETHDLCMKAHLRLCDDNTKLATENAELRSQYKPKDDALQEMIKEYESEIKQIIELAKSYGLIIYDDRKDAIPDDATNIGMCGHYYVLGGRNKEESKDIKKLEEKWKKAENTVKELMQVLNYEHIDVSHSKSSWTINNRALTEKTKHFNTQLDNLREKLKEMERSRNNWRAHYVDMSDICSRDEDDSEMLQAILRKDGYTIEYDGDIDDETVRCQDSLNICKETTQDEVTYQYGRWTLKRPWNFSEAKANADAAILRGQIISRDRTISELRANYNTAEHECEELEKKFKELVKENEDLRSTLKMCERDANMSRSLCHNIAFNAERARNKMPWFNDMQGDDI